MARDDIRSDQRDLSRRSDVTDPDFQRQWLAARRLDWDQVERAVRHGVEAVPRFADRPFDEVLDWLRSSWTAMGTDVPWDDVADLVRSGYERFGSTGSDDAGLLAPEALRTFAVRTIGGSALGGAAGDARPDESGGGRLDGNADGR
jgi:hypothetical protein